MKRVIILAAIVGALLGWFLESMEVGADDRRYLRQTSCSGYECSPPPLLPQQEALIDTGVWFWEYRQDQGVPSLHAPIQAALDDFAFETGLLALEAPGGNLQVARSSSTFYYGDGFSPGCPGAVGCLNRYPTSLQIWYDAPVMATYFFRSQVQVALHEGAHAIADAGEMYVHTGGRISCDGKSWTFMSCGIGTSLFFTAFDRVTVSRYLLPQSFTGGVLVGDAVVYGTSDSRTTRIAVYYETYTGFRFWTGQTLPVVSGVSVERLALPLGRCTGVLLGSENALPISWGRDLQLIGWSSCE